MSKKLLIIIPCFFLSNIILSSDGEAIIQEKKSGTITGTIKVKGVRDAGDIVVFLEKVEGVFIPSEEKPVLDQKNMIFIPHILPVLVGTTVKFPNSDNVTHNVFSPSPTKKFNLGTYASGVVRELTFDTPGVIAVLCNVHAEMSAFIVVLGNPFFALTGPDGKFTINNVPAGAYKIITWHEKLKEQEQEVTVSSNKTVIVNFNLSR